MGHRRLSWRCGTRLDRRALFDEKEAPDAGLRTVPRAGTGTLSTPNTFDESPWVRVCATAALRCSELGESENADEPRSTSESVRQHDTASGGAPISA